MNRHHWISLGFILFGIAGILMAMNIQSIYTVATEDIGPKMFPIFACCGIILASIGKFLTAPKGKIKPFLKKESWIRIGVMLGMFILYYLALKYLGFLISTPVFLYAQIRYMSLKKVSVLKSIIISIVLTAVLYVIFNNLIQCILPTGELF